MFQPQNLMEWGREGVGANLKFSFCHPTHPLHKLLIQDRPRIWPPAPPNVGLSHLSELLAELPAWRPESPPKRQKDPYRTQSTSCPSAAQNCPGASPLTQGSQTLTVADRTLHRDPFGPQSRLLLSTQASLLLLDHTKPSLPWGLCSGYSSA